MRMRMSLVCLVVACPGVACSGPSTTPKGSDSQAAHGSSSAADGSPGAGVDAAKGNAPPHATPQQTVAAARKAIDDWLAALVREDPGAMIAHSTSAAKGLGGVQIVEHAIIRGHGSSISTRVARELISQAHVAAAAVTVAGQIDLRDTSTGLKKRAIANPTTGPIEVVYENGAWKVRTFTYDNATMRYFPELAQQTIDDLHFPQGVVLTFGTTTRVAA